MSDLTPKQINEILREADGWIYIEHLDSWHLPEIKKPRLMDTVSSRNLPDYTTSYDDLARVERQVYGHYFSIQVEFLDQGQVPFDTRVNVGIDEEYLTLSSNRSTELHARAEVCAMVAREQGI